MLRMHLILTLLFLPLLGDTLPASQALAQARVSPKDANLQNAVVSFAQRNLGKTVLPPASTRAPSDAQCTDLAEAALISAGGKTEAQLGPTGPDANYVWGTLHRAQVARGELRCAVNGQF